MWRRRSIYSLHLRTRWANLSASWSECPWKSAKRIDEDLQPVASRPVALCRRNPPRGRCGHLQMERRRPILSRCNPRVIYQWSGSLVHGLRQRPRCPETGLLAPSPRLTRFNQPAFGIFCQFHPTASQQDNPEQLHHCFSYQPSKYFVLSLFLNFNKNDKFRAFCCLLFTLNDINIFVLHLFQAQWIRKIRETSCWRFVIIIH